MFIIYGKYRNCTSKNLFGLLSKGSSFLKKWMFKSMKLNSIIWSQSYNWGSMYVQDSEWTSLSPKKVRQWCQNKTKTSYPAPPEKTNIKTLKNWWLHQMISFPFFWWFLFRERIRLLYFQGLGTSTWTGIQPHISKDPHCFHGFP